MKQENKMKNLALLGAFALVCSAPAFGQSPNNPTRQSQTPDEAQGQSTRSGKSGRTVTLTGCVEQRSGKYVLMTEGRQATNENGASSTTQSEQQGTYRNHPREIELTGNQDLQNQVGHTVSVTGTIHHKSAMNENNSSATEPNNQQTAQNPSSQNSNSSERNRTTMHVTSVQPVSNSCQTSSGTSSQPR
jgi:hypothetical protein